MKCLDALEKKQLPKDGYDKKKRRSAHSWVTFDSHRKNAKRDH